MWATVIRKQDFPTATVEVARPESQKGPAEHSRERNALLVAPQHTPVPSACALDAKEASLKHVSLRWPIKESEGQDMRALGSGEICVSHPKEGLSRGRS